MVLRFPPPFDPTKETSPSVILEFAKQLENSTIEEVLSAHRPKWWSSGTKDKGAIGNLVQEFLGLPPNPRREADFFSAKTELKILPIMKGVRTPIKVKERTVLSNINYCKLLGEKWEAASFRDKLARILFVIVLVDSVRLEESRIFRVRLWSPTVDDLQAMREDWERLRTAVRVAAESKHFVNPSESLGLVLAACRHGSGGEGDTVRLDDCYPGVTGMRRALSLKPAFTRRLILEWTREVQFVSVMQHLRKVGRSASVEDFQQHVLSAIQVHRNSTIGAIREKLDLADSNSKNLTSKVVRKFLGQAGDEIAEFEQFNVTVRTLNLRTDDHQPWEGVSLAPFKLREFAQEPEFETSELAQRLQLVLFIQTTSPKRGLAQDSRRLEGGFFWRPSADELAGIAGEWKTFQLEVIEGKARYEDSPNGRRHDRLTKETATEFIHIRPHARNRNDFDEDPLGQKTTKRSFWLNKKLLQRLSVAAAR